jgi:DNA topoisomerase-3
LQEVEDDDGRNSNRKGDAGMDAQQFMCENERGFFCENRACAFKLWKDNIFFKSKKKNLTKNMAAALLKEGRVFISGLYSEKTDKKYDATVIMDDTGGKYVNFKLEFERKGAKHESKTKAAPRP